jgi:hypothetical protein
MRDTVGRGPVEMVKLVVSRRYPFVSLADLSLRARVEQLREENEQLRGRLVAAQDEKGQALHQAEELRKQKERLRVKIAGLKQAAEEQRKVQEVLEGKLQVVREENEELKHRS